MRLVQIVANLATVLLLTWLLLRGIDGGASAIDGGTATLDEFAIAQTGLERDVLRARVGMLRNYDPLVGEVRTLYGTIERLRPVVGGDSELSGELDRLVLLTRQQESLTEQFKTENALLQNSLAYFELFSTRLTARGGEEPLIRQVNDLATALLRFTTDTSATAAAVVDDRLEKLSVTGTNGPQSETLKPLMAHARMLRKLLPATDETVKSLFAVPNFHQAMHVGGLLQARSAALKNKADVYRYTLYGMSLLLFGSLIQVGKRLQARASTLRRRAQIERAIAAISTRFINSRPPETAQHIGRALAELAGLIGADRAYFVPTGQAANAYKWCRPGREFPSGWPEAAPAVASGLDAGAHGVIQIHDVGDLAESGTAYALRGANLHSWLCIPGSRAVLGFDSARPGTDLAWSESGLLRMAFDAIANALSRESLERDRERLQENLQSARRMETIGAFASGIAHNFNNIIGAILGFTETALSHVRPGSRPVESLGEIRRAGERARDLVHQILTFGRRGDARRAPVHLNSLVAEAKLLLDASLSPYVNIIVHTTAESAVVMGEAAQLQQVILNVCNNAAQAIDAPGSIEIEVGVQELEQAVQTEHGELAPGRHALISVTDPGRGMDELTLERIFEPFFSTRVGGNGLGLATVREIVLQHSGAVKVRSAPGAGTQFDIWLPCAALAESASVAEPQHGFDRGSGETVLVIESDRKRLLRHEEILAALGYEPVGFTDAEEAAAACRMTPTRFDAALLCCPAHAGPRVGENVAVLRAHAPDLPVILAAPSARDIAAPSLAGAGIAEIIRQPLTSAELAGALAGCLLPR